MAIAKHAGGRPSEFKLEYIKRVDDYLTECQDYYESKQDNRLKVRLPTLEGFSLFIDVSLASLDAWSKICPEFSGALSKIDRLQKKRLIEMSLSSEYNSTIAKLMLSANHGMSEKNITDITSNGEKIGGFNYIKPSKEDKK